MNRIESRQKEILDLRKQIAHEEEAVEFIESYPWWWDRVSG